MGVSNQLYDQIRSLYNSKIDHKTELTIEHAASFLRRYFSDEHDFYICLSGDLIADAVMKYFVDIQRFKERRGMSSTDFTSSGKIASFTAKWLVKTKPMHITPKNPKNVPRNTLWMIRHINEIFAVEHSEFIINKPLPRKLFAELVLDFRQKKFSETQLYMTLENHMGYYAD